MSKLTPNNKSKEYSWDNKKGLIKIKKDPISKTNKRRELKELLKHEILTMLNEEITYNFPFKDKKFKIRFDVNANPTKKGIKIQFIPAENLTQNPNEARQIINELQIFLNQKLGNIGMAADFDPDVPYQNVIGFTVKLGSISNMVVKALGGIINNDDNQKKGNNLNPLPNEKT